MRDYLKAPDNFPDTGGEVLLRIERPDGRDAITARVTPAEPTFAIPVEPSLAEVTRLTSSSGCTTSCSARTTCSSCSPCC